jgi:Lon protease-like protein
MSDILADLPLFPLNTVLFPDGLLPLRIFEARYIDMVRTCLRENTEFGVCLLHSGAEVAQPGMASTPEAIGCLARIIDIDIEQFGLMSLRTRGTTRFKLLEWHTESDGLLRGDASLIGPDTETTGSEHLQRLGVCAEVLERIIETFRSRDPDNLPFLEPFELTNAAWVSNRLGEILPISLRARQKLMELDDATARLEVVHHYMVQHAML